MSLQELRTHIIEAVNHIDDEKKLETLAGMADQMATPAKEDGITDEMYAAALRGRAQIAAGNFYTEEQARARVQATIARVAAKGTNGAA